MLRSIVIALAFSAATTCCAQTTAQRDTTLAATVQSIVNEPAVARAHWGISVTRLDGTRLFDLNDGQYFMPASNTKLFTTATVMALLPTDERLITEVMAFGTSLENGVLKGELVLAGAADANLSGRPVPYVPPLADGTTPPPRDELRYIDELADQVKAKGIRRVEGDVRGDELFYDYQPYPPDWSMDDAVWYYGAPVSALMIADNAITVTIRPGAVKHGAEGDSYEKPSIEFNPDLPYYTIDADQLLTFPDFKPTHVEFLRIAGSKALRIRGVVLPGSAPYVQAISIDDPAEYAAMGLKRALERRGITVTGKAYAKHDSLPSVGDAEMLRDAATHDLGKGEPQQPADHLAQTASSSNFPFVRDCDGASTIPPGLVFCRAAQHVGPPLYEDVVVTNKVSQNQHAELMLRLLPLSLRYGSTTALGALMVRRFAIGNAGIDPMDFFLNDGSGMSTHDLITPRAITKLLSYATTQPWGTKWKASLPVGGVDGSLRSRFAAPPLAGHVFAKTGTLGEARALSGYLDCASGQTVAFSVMVSTHTPLNNEDQKAMDRILAAIAAAE